MTDMYLRELAYGEIFIDGTLGGVENLQIGKDIIFNIAENVRF